MEHFAKLNYRVLQLLPFKTPAVSRGKKKM